MATPSLDIRRARAFLRRKGVEISPRRFATAAEELGKTFAELLELIMRLRAGGQGQGQAPIATRIALKEQG